MVNCLFPLQYLVATCALWLNREQQVVIDYLKEENRRLKATLGARKLIIDRDTRYCKTFRELLEQSGTTIIHLPTRSPNLNAYAERFVGSIKAECLNRLIFVGEASLRRALQEYSAHYHYERNHQGIDNQLIAANEADFAGDGAIKRRGRLGGMLDYYHREAA